MTGARRPVFQAPASELRPADARADDSKVAVYVRLIVKDEPGVIARVTEALADSGVSIDSFLQRPAQDVVGVPIVMTTHPASEAAIAEAVQRMSALADLIARPRVLPLARV